MTLNYDSLWHLLIDRHMTKSELRRATGMSSGTFAKLSKGEPVTTSTLAKICDVLKCDIGDIISYAPRNGLVDPGRAERGLARR